MAYFYFFIGAYLYEKITGVVTLPTLPKKREEEEVIEEPEEGMEEGIISKIKNKISKWKEEREKKKSEKAELEKEKELESLSDKRTAELEAKKRQLDEERAEFKEQRKQEQLMRQKELEAKRREREEARKKAEREKLWKERKERAKGLLHKIGLFMTPEEKRQIALQKEKEKQERLGREDELKQQKEQQRLAEEKRKEGLRRQKELEEKRRQEEQRRTKLEEEKTRQEESRKKEEERKQKDIIKEQEIKQRELEAQRQEQIRAQRLGRIEHITARLNKNKEIAEKLNSELRRIDSEKEILSNTLKQTDSKIVSIEHEIIEKSKQSEEASRQKSSLLENYKNHSDELNKKLEIDKNARQEKIKDLKAGLAERQAELMREVEEELSKLSPAKRKSVERWKRLEAKAKLKIEEQNVEEELKRHASKVANEKQEIEYSYRKSMQDINRRQRALKQEIADLESHKQQIITEKRNAPRDLQSKDNEISRIRLKLELLANEQKQLASELSKLKSGLWLKWTFSNLFGKAKPELKSKDVKEEKQIPEREITAFERLFGKEGEEKIYREEENKLKKRKTELKLEEIEEKQEEEEKPVIGGKPQEEKKSKSEVEELEEAIRGLDLFKKKAIEEKPIKEKIKEPEKKITVSGKKLEKFYKELNEAEDSINKNNISKAKKLYVDARNAYVELGNEDKKEVYNKLMELYNKLK